MIYFDIGGIKNLYIYIRNKSETLNGTLPLLSEVSLRPTTNLLCAVPLMLMLKYM